MSENYLEEFLEYLQQVKGYSDQTLRAYSSDMRQFLDFLAGYGEEDLFDLERKTFRAYLANLTTAAYAKRTLARKLATLRSFFRFQMKKGRIKQHPMAGLKNPRLEKPLPKFLDEEEVMTLLDAPAMRNGKLSKRDQGILEILYSTGIRVSELVGINVEDIDFSNEVLRVRGKGKKERLVPVGRTALNALEYYLDERGATREGSEAVFLNRFGNRITDRSIRRIIQKYCRAASLLKQVSPHTIRHTFATHLLNHGAQLRAVQELLGHANLSTTQIYTHIATDRLKTIYDQTHPRA